MQNSAHKVYLEASLTTRIQTIFTQYQLDTNPHDMIPLLKEITITHPNLKQNLGIEQIRILMNEKNEKIFNILLNGC